MKQQSTERAGLLLDIMQAADTERAALLADWHRRTFEIAQGLAAARARRAQAVTDDD